MNACLIRPIPALLAAALLLPLTGCFVESRRGANGDKDVNISTPLGEMRVKTDAASVQAKVGLPLYPGAAPEKKKGKDDDNSADVNMSFGIFHLRVLALSFTSADSPDKVSAFYRKALEQYSDVILCKDKKAIGTPTKTGLGLTCSDDGHGHTRVGDAGDAETKHGEWELKAGSPSRQHLVSYKADGSGTKFALVALELPRDDNNAAN